MKSTSLCSWALVPTEPKIPELRILPYIITPQDPLDIRFSVTLGRGDKEAV